MIEPSKSRSLRGPRIALVLVIVAALLVAHRLGVFEQFAEPARVRQTLVDLGPWGYLAFVVAFVVIQPFGIPGSVFILAASLIWPWPVAFGLSMMGSLGASVVGFSIARFVARDTVARVIPARFAKYDEALARRAFLTVCFLRMIFWMSPLLHGFLGVSKVRFSTHFYGSAVGYLLPVFLISFFGEKLFDALRSAPVYVWVALGVAIAAVTLGVLWRRRRGVTSRA